MNPHVQLLEKAQRLLTILQRKFVFVGGATVSLHIDDRAASAVRATEDVDLVVEVTSYSEYSRIEKTLRDSGFSQLALDDESPICRWEKEELLLDVMPTEPEILSFPSSKWFQRGFDSAREYDLPSGTRVEAFDALHLMAAKIEAFEDRGDGDWLGSKDIEDLAAILDGRSSIFDELDADSDAARFVRTWLLQQGEDLTRNLAGHVHGYERAHLLVERLKKLRN